jgi:hypothetical protein
MAKGGGGIKVKLMKVTEKNEEKITSAPANSIRG